MRAGTCAALACSVLAAVLAGALHAAPDEDAHWRPQFHYSPAQHWMNDPNGLVWADGEWHLFYQYYPGASVWGPMHWGHAVSRDLLHWQELPVALAPDAHGMVFSGSIVNDVLNTSGFGSGARAPLVAMYTIHDEARKARGLMGYESQGLAWSTDAGRTWTKYAGNPVLTLPTQPDFRDPKPFWHEATKRWVVVLATGDHVGLYSSGDLRHWRHESDFGAGLGAHGGVWECPDLLPLPYEGGTRWLMLVSVGEGAPNGGSGTQYFVGDFDGRSFHADAAPGARWVDYGTDNYAGSTWSGGPPGDARTLFIGWMSNWQYAAHVPTTTWRSSMTLPRELSLVRSAGATELRSRPAAELAALRVRSATVAAREVSGAIDLLAASRPDPAGERAGLYELDLAIDLRDARHVELAFANSAGERTLFRVDRGEGRYVLERASSGKVDFSKAFPAVQSAPIPAGALAGGQLALQVFLDRNSIELFINEGQTVMTALVFPTTPYNRILLDGDAPIGLAGATLHDLQPSGAARHGSGPAR